MLETLKNLIATRGAQIASLYIGKVLLCIAAALGYNAPDKAALLTSVPFLAAFVVGLVLHVVDHCTTTGSEQDSATFTAGFKRGLLENANPIPQPTMTAKDGAP